jgi:hypothetical protein
MFLLNNIKVSEGAQRTIGDTQYPPLWFNDPLERAKVGMIEVPDLVRPDDNLFTSVENPDGSWTATPRTAADLAARLAQQAVAVRADRNAKLAVTDWTQGADIPQATKNKYAPYRQALRDVPAQAGFPSAVIWPTQE